VGPGRRSCPPPSDTDHLPPALEFLSSAVDSRSISVMIDAIRRHRVLAPAAAAAAAASPSPEAIGEA
jgi:hypothetical protein